MLKRPESTEHAPVPIAAGHLLACLAVLALLGLLSTWTLHVAAVTLPSGMIAYLLIPGLLLQMALGPIRTLSLSLLLYSFGISIAYWILGSLVLNTALPMLSFPRPLRLLPLTIFYIASIATLCVIGWIRSSRTSIALPYLRITSATTFIIALSLLLPVLSLLGSTMLNNGGSGYITIVLLMTIVMLLMMVSIMYKSLSSFTYPILLICIASSLLLMYSMRSSYVVGFDIHKELRVFTTVLSNGRWRMSDYPRDPYNACLSITLLPAALADLFHISSEYVFKLIYPMMFSVTAVIVYAAARRFLSPVLSFFAGVLLVAQGWFLEQMPALARQEIALILFGLLVLSLVDSNLVRVRRTVVTYVLIIALVLSHYSTAYVWLLLLAIAVVLRYATVLIWRRTRARGSNTLLWMMLASMFAMFMWQGPITHSSGQAVAMVGTSVSEQLNSAFSPAVIETGVRTAFGALPSPNTDAAIGAAYAHAVATRSGTPQAYYPTARYAGYSPHAVDDRVFARSYLPRLVATSAMGFASLVKGAVISVFPALGIIILLFAYFRNTSRSRYEITLLCTSAFLLMLIVLFTPYIQEKYNLSRLYIQLLMILAIPSLIGLWYAARRSARYGVPLIGLAIVVVLILSTGLLDQATGGALRVTMTDPNGRFDTFYVYETEIAAARWLAANRDGELPVFADDIAGLRLQSYTSINPTSAVFPATVTRNGYVYLIRANTYRKHGFINYKNLPLVYNYPNAFLNSNKDLIYNNGQAEVYK